MAGGARGKAKAASAHRDVGESSATLQPESQIAARLRPAQLSKSITIPETPEVEELGEEDDLVAQETQGGSENREEPRSLGDGETPENPSRPRRGPAEESETTEDEEELDLIQQVQLLEAKNRANREAAALRKEKLRARITTLATNQPSADASGPSAPNHSKDESHKTKQKELRERIAALERETRSLAKTTRKRRATPSESEEPDDPSSEEGDDDSTSDSSSDSDSGSETSERSYRRSRSLQLKPTEPLSFGGKNFMEAGRFLTECDLYFRQLGVKKDDKKVLKAGSLLKDELRDKWFLEVRRLDSERGWKHYFWADFCKWLKNAMQHEIVRETEYNLRFLDLRQRADQSASRFQEYFNSVRENAPTTFMYDEKDLADQFFLRLTAPVRNEIMLMTQNKIPRTVKGIVEIAEANAARLKMVQKEESSSKASKASKAAERPSEKASGSSRYRPRRDSEKRRSDGERTPREYRSKEYRGRDSKKSYEKGRTNRTTVTCYNCNKTGHIKPDCPDLNKSTAQLAATTSSKKGNERKPKKIKTERSIGKD
jgi:hypothetical protein